MADLLMGAVAMSSAVAALFFARFWRRTCDRFFLLFSLAFAIDAVTRLALGLTEVPDEQQPYFYVARLFTFGLILIAIIDKNRISRKGKK
jgi:Family of unknown function (DUF5985)